MSELTYQQKVVIERINVGNEKVLTANEAIKGRANFITGASTAVVGIITAAKYLPSGAANEGFEYILLALVCTCSIAIYWLAALVWKGGVTAISGSTDIDVLYESYIGQDIDTAYCNFLADTCEAKKKNSNENALQAARLDRMIFTFMMQLALLALAIGWTSFAAYV
ncbi:hypothetical protein [uncultured Paraglaciecola sp.]|uniref:hypothetical protein n=1 Tax=uncultured Paraglaciecola sp. TaxID=1765024 RepID=UPI00260CB2AD|nr:hypothetical protein [uncultured Paraglaciecola sp.]